MYFISGCDNDITRSRSSLWGLKKMKMIKQVLKKILKVQQENGEKKNVLLRGIDPAMPDPQTSTLATRLFGPM